MNRIATIMLCAAVFMFGGASSCQKPAPTNPVVAGVVNCAEEGIHNAEVHIIDDVASALATGDYVAGLEALVKQFGEGAVDCAVREVGSTSGAHAKFDSLEETKAQRAQQWLASRPVKLSQRARWPRVYIAGICTFCGGHGG